MKIPLDRIKQLYQLIVENALDSQGISTYIFVSNETDSLCALKILTNILKADEVQFAQIPVFSNGHLEQEIKKLASQQYVSKPLLANFNSA